MLTTLQFKKMILSGLLAKSSLFGGGADVGGGDLIRADFLNRGEAVISFLKTSPQGQALVKENNLDVEKLSQSLDVGVVRVSDQTLIDRTGSVVDALGEPGLILLNQQRWMTYAENDLDNYFLVFHEMLREAGINDDNYVISKKIADFPSDFQIKQLLTSKKPLLVEDTLADVIQKKDIIYAGKGCPADSARTLARFDSSTNQFEIYPSEMTAAVGSNQRTLDRSNCTMALPYKAKPGQKIVVTQIDLNGEVDLKLNKNVSIDFSAFQVGGQQTTKNKAIVTTTKGNSAGFLFRENQNFETSCGGQGMIRLNSAASITDQGNKKDTEISYVKVNKITLSMKSVACSK